MRKSRFPSRVVVAILVVLRLLFDWRTRRAPARPSRILIAHHLLLGDTLMLTPLLAKLREQHPGAEILMTCPKAFAGLYEKAPYGVRAIAYDPRDPKTLWRLWRARGFDLALLPADNRFSGLARALGARWIVAFAGDRPAYKSWLVDRLVPYPSQPGAWADLVTTLVDGPAPAPYGPDDWVAPNCTQFVLPASPYAVLHVGAGSPLRHWESAKWQAVAKHLASTGLNIIWSAGAGETELVRKADPEQRHRSLAGQLDLPQMWRLLAHARLLVVPDTGISHLGRVAGVPTVTLFGPGSAVLFGSGEFWRNNRYRAVTIADFPCRDERVIFRREIEWVRHCARFHGSPPERCAEPRCMHGIMVADVQAAVRSVLQEPGPTFALEPGAEQRQ